MNNPRNVLEEFYQKIMLEYESLQNSNSISAVFADLNKKSKKIVYSHKIAKQPHNEQRNRYSDVLAHDGTLYRSSSVPYINANVADGIYIMTQGPLYFYMADFWTMVFESNAKIILCLTKEKENKKSKFDAYYNDDQEARFNHYLVKVESKIIDDNIVIRQLIVSLLRPKPESNLESEIRIISNKNDSVHSDDFMMFESDEETISPELETVETRTITQIQYTGWPDFGLPTDVNEFLKIFTIVDDISPATPETPLVIHCSAGIGRTGTFCAIHRVNEHVKSILKNKKTNLINNPLEGQDYLMSNIILDLRKYRTGLVQTEEQFKFCYLAAIQLLYTYSMNTALL